MVTATFVRVDVAAARVTVAPFDADSVETPRPLLSSQDVKLAAVKGAEPGGGATVTVHGLKPLPDGGYYELWMLNSPTDLVSMGSFTVDASGTATVTLPVAADPAKFKFFDVSVEPGDGKPGHSGISVLRAPTTSA